VLLVDRLQRDDARAVLNAKSARIHDNTLTSLLSVMCDTVVHLDNDYRITKPCPQLSVLLFRQISLAAADEGDVNFLSFMSEEDRQRFVDCISEEVVDGERIPARTTLIRLVSANGVRVPLRIFCVGFTNMFGRQAYSIGIQEDAEAAQVLGDLSYGETVLDTQERTCRNIIQSIEADPGSAVEGSEGSSCSGSDISVIPSGVVEQTCTVKVTIDAFDNALPIRACSTGFMALCSAGDDPKAASIVKWLKDGATFQTFVQECVNEAASVENHSGVFPFGSIRIIPPSVTNKRIQYEARCVVTIPNRHRHRNYDSDGYLVDIEFKELVVRIRRQQRRRLHAADDEATRGHRLTSSSTPVVLSQTEPARATIGKRSFTL